MSAIGKCTENGALSWFYLLRCSRKTGLAPKPQGPRGENRVPAPVWWRKASRLGLSFVSQDLIKTPLLGVTMAVQRTE